MVTADNVRKLIDELEQKIIDNPENASAYREQIRKIKSKRQDLLM